MIYILSKIRKKLQFSSINYHFTAVKNRIILHIRVIVMHIGYQCRRPLLLDLELSKWRIITVSAVASVNETVVSVINYKTSYLSGRFAKWRDITLIISNRN